MCGGLVTVLAAAASPGAWPVLEVSVDRGSDSGVIINVGFILLAGQASANEHHHFMNLSTAGG